MSNVGKTITIDLCLIIFAWDNVYVCFDLIWYGILCRRSTRFSQISTNLAVFSLLVVFLFPRWVCFFQHGILHGKPQSGFSIFLFWFDHRMCEERRRRNKKQSTWYFGRQLDIFVSEQSELVNATNVFALITWKLVVKMHKTCWCDRWN